MEDTKKASKGKAAAPAAAAKGKAKGKSIDESPLRPEPTPKQEVATTTTTKSELAEPKSNMTGVSGEWDRDDLLLPRLNLVAKTSELVDDGFTPGAWVVNKELEIALKEEDLTVIILMMDKKYQEDIPFDSEEQPRIFSTKQEMHEAGYSSEYGSEAYCQPLANFTLLVKLPADVTDETGIFCHTIGKDSFALVALTVSKTAYKTTAKLVASHLAFSGADGLHKSAWTLYSKLKTYGDKAWFSPFLKKGNALTDAQLKDVENIIGGM